MKTTFFFCSVLLMMTFVACDNSNASKQDAQIEYPTSNLPSDLSLTSATTADTIQHPTGTNTISLPASPVKSAAGLNPAHGQPGHRCDISVGAPLDGKPIQGANITQPATNNPPPLPINVNPPPPVQKVAAGMNPAHGQPGHRCDISVGAPLNSKPVASPLPQSAPTLPIIPLKKDSTNN